MSNSFFGKLNHLVKAHVNSILDPIDEEMSKSRKKALSRQDIRGGLQKDVKVLRQRIDDALNHQDKLQAKVDKLYQDIADWDRKADEALEAGKQDVARYALERMQQANRDLAMTEADLKEHSYITQELISQVNMLDATIQTSQDEAPQEEDSPSEPTSEDIGRQIIQQLDNTREKLSGLISEYTAKVTGSDAPQKPLSQKYDIIDEEPEPPHQVKHPVKRDKVDDELSARISRLSKPEDDK
jgi:phage shock protein A